MEAAVVNMHEAKTHFSKLVARAARGEEIIIAKAGRPQARLMAVADNSKPRLGTARGKGWVADDFNAPLPEDIQQYFQ